MTPVETYRGLVIVGDVVFGAAAFELATPVYELDRAKNPVARGDGTLRIKGSTVHLRGGAECEVHATPREVVAGVAAAMVWGLG